MKGESYRADIDGLRALAILPVIFYHAKLGCPGGFVGVDVFFVISGYLITSLILKEIQAGRFSLAQFWERRIRRILPALAVVVLASLVAAWFCFLPADFAAAGKSAVAQVFLISNIFFWSQSGYFDATSEAKPLLHTWSLAVEEQFYLFFPLFLLCWSRFCKQPVSFVKVTTGIAIISFGASVYSTYACGSFSFYWLPTRAWELMIGALLAMTREQLPASRTISESLGWLGVFLVMLVVFLYDDNTRFPGLAAVAPCLGTALVIYSSESAPSQVGRILSFKPLVFAGLISYSLYLWHWPMLVFCRYWSFEEPGNGFRAGLLGISGVLAFLSWKYVETPIRRRLVFKSRAQIFSFAACAGILVLAAGAAIDEGRGFPSHKPGYNNLRFVDGHTNAFFNANATVDDALAGKFLGLGVDALETATNRPVNLVLWGDSHAQALGPMVDDLEPSPFVEKCSGRPPGHSAGFGLYFPGQGLPARKIT